MCLFVPTASGGYIHVSFDVKSGKGTPLSPHQVFVKFSPVDAAAKVKPSVFVATQESAGSYRVSIDTSSRDALKTLLEGASP
jgi:hypothetical protein